jgi:Polysaccharide deacetylase
MNPIAVATEGKGLLGLVRRAQTISRRYGVTAGRMSHTLAHFAAILQRFQCGATFPITTAALARSSGVIERYQAQQIEFAVHGLYHIDHRRLSLDAQLGHFARARSVFAARGVACYGFRSPYLRWSEQTIAAVARSGFLYDSSQGLAWEVVSEVETAAYRRVLGFYGARSAADYPALPRLADGLVRIPYCLPDDESLIDRFRLATDAPMIRLWLAILAETHRLGELFTLGLHPERTLLCEAPLTETLRSARALRPAVWIARLDEIARWWQARAEASVTVAQAREVGAERQADDGPPVLQLSVDGPEGTTILARGVELLSAATRWDGVYQRVSGTTAALRSDRRPFIGISHRSAPALTSFLRQQGYLVEPAADAHSHTLHLDRPRFAEADERPLLRQIEADSFPLVRLGRWPHGARSALCITGDIDALTIWDYGLRSLGR